MNTEPVSSQGSPLVPAPPTESTMENRRDGLALACLALAAIAVYFGAEIFLLSGSIGFPLDDSWIHLTFAKNLAAGKGLSYGAADSAGWVTGSTAPLWTAWLGLLAWLPVSLPLAAKLSGIAFHVVSVLATRRLGLLLGLSRGLANLCGVFVACTAWMVWSALSGMEIPLFVALTLIGVNLFLQEGRDSKRPVLSPLLFALSALARPEGLLLLGLAFLLSARPELLVAPRRGWWAWLGAAAVLLPTIAFYWWVGGSPLPTTFQVKAGGGGGLADHLPKLRYLYTVLGISFPQLPWLTLLALGGGATLLSASPTSPTSPTLRWRGLLPLLWFLALPIAYSMVAPPGRMVVGNFGRYFFPLLPFLVVLGVLALQQVINGLARRSLEDDPQRFASSRRLAWLLGLFILLAPTAVSFVDGASRYGRSVLDIERGDVEVARWVEANIPPDAVLAALDIGAIGYQAPNPLVDLAGIVSPEVHRFIAEAEAAGQTWHQGVLAFLESTKPEFVVVFPNWLPVLGAASSPYRPVHAVDVPGNITLGGDRIVIYSTPWTRGRRPTSKEDTVENGR